MNMTREQFKEQIVSYFRDCLNNVEADMVTPTEDDLDEWGHPFGLQSTNDPAKIPFIRGPRTVRFEMRSGRVKVSIERPKHALSGPQRFTMGISTFEQTFDLSNTEK